MLLIVGFTNKTYFSELLVDFLWVLVDFGGFWLGALLERENLRGPRPWLPLGDEVTIRGSNKLLSGVMVVVVVVVGQRWG